MPKNFTDKDMGWNKLYTVFKASKNDAVYVGYLESSGEYIPKKKGKNSKPITMAQLAAIHEFGAPNAKIPERSFMRWVLEGTSSAKVERFCAKLLEKVTQGKLGTQQALGLIGQFVQDKMKSRIDSNIPPRLKHRNGTALHDSGQLLGKISWQIVSGKK